MKKLTFVAASTVLMGTAALAYAQSGNSDADTWVATLTAEGYSDIDIEIEDGQIEIEGLKDGVEREIVLDEATGTVLRDTTEIEDEEEDDKDEDEIEDGSLDSDGD